MQNFDRNRSMQLGIKAAIHGCHTAITDDTFDVIMCEQKFCEGFIRGRFIFLLILGELDTREMLPTLVPKIIWSSHFRENRIAVTALSNVLRPVMAFEMVATVQQ